MSRENARFTEYIDTSWIGKFPPGFFQKGEEHIKNHPDEQFRIQVTKDRVFMRRQKKLTNGVRPKDPINGRIITWCPATLASS